MVGESLGATAHHVRALVRRGLIEWAGERRARGAVQTFYTATQEGRSALAGPRVEAVLAFVAPQVSGRLDDDTLMRIDDLLNTTIARRVRDMPEVQVLLAEYEGHAPVTAP